MKQDTVIVKVEKKMKADLIKLAKENNREFSDFMRQLFQKAINEKTKI